MEAPTSECPFFSKREEKRPRPACLFPFIQCVTAAQVPWTHLSYTLAFLGGELPTFCRLSCLNVSYKISCFNICKADSKAAPSLGHRVWVGAGGVRHTRRFRRTASTGPLRHVHFSTASPAWREGEAGALSPRPFLPQQRVRALAGWFRRRGSRHGRGREAANQQGL